MRGEDALAARDAAQQRRKALVASLQEADDAAITDDWSRTQSMTLRCRSAWMCWVLGS